MTLDLRKSLDQFRLIALAEGCSYLLLFVTMVLKYRYGLPKPNYVVGLAHGLLFVAYVVLLAKVGVEKSWGFGKIVLLFLASLLPFGSFYAEAKWLSKEA